jgi:hypothetical protein
MKAYRASANGSGFTAPTPRQAAIKFFTSFPTKRKCDIIEGEANDGFFTVKFGRASEGEWPQSWKAITKKQIDTLPDSEGANHARHC